MTEIDLLSWLPAQSRMMLAAEQREEDSAEREAKRARIAKHEELEARATAAYISDAARRGEHVSPVDAVNGRIGRTLEEILLGAQGELADRVPAALREPNAEWLGAAEPVIVHAPTARGLVMFNRYRHWKDALDSKRAAETAQKAAAASRNDYGFVCERRGRDDSDPVADVTVPRRRRATDGDSGVRFR